MPSWPQEPKHISKRTRRYDAVAKLTGRARYAADAQPAGWLYGMILRAKWPAAKVAKINLDKALKAPGIKAAITASDGERTIRYYGEELAAVAGTSKQACLDALQLIEVDATPLPFVVREDDARQEDAPKVWEGSSNISKPRSTAKGDVDQAFAECAAVIEGFYSTPVQLHHPMETSGSTASWTDEGLTSWVSTQAVFGVRDGLAANLKLEQSKVRVLCEHMGGGFGSKLGPNVEHGLAARLSRAAKAPVKLMLTRFDNALAAGNRPSSFQKIKLGAKSNGKLHAFQLESYGTAGYISGSTGGAGGGATFPAPYIYDIPNIRVSQVGVAVNGCPARPMRAPGHPQASFGMECALDDLAARLGHDPLELRLKNDPDPIRQREWQLGAERFGWKIKFKKPGSSPGQIKTGVGCAGATWPGVGNRNTRAEVQINPDGSVEVRCGTQDIGTGTHTVMAVVAAEVLGLQPEQITVKLGDTRFPWAGASGGSTTAPSVAPAVFDACSKALDELQKQSGTPDARGGQWPAACAKLGVTSLIVQGQWQEGLSSSGACGAQFAEAAVDTETGLVALKQIVCVQDCGLVVSRLTCESQVYSGIVMGIGYALYEERIMDRRSGVVLNPNFETYKLPGIADMPDIDIVLLDMPERGVIGVGEPVTIPTAAAIANAVANALGVRVPSLPITPAKVLAALGKA
jgi:xanthine dehydrogenase YagR molybdenum-binding subunit